MTKANWIDVSYFQDPEKFDYQAAKQDGIQGLIIRAGYGKTQDTAAAQHIANAQKYGFMWHLYHYWYNMDGEAEWAVQNAKSLGLTANQYLFLDMEDKSLPADWNGQFAVFRKAVGDTYKVGLYCSDSPYKAKFQDSQLQQLNVARWIASYSYEPANYDIWQLSGAGGGGFGSYTGDVDRDYAKSNILSLYATANINPVVVQPTADLQYIQPIMLQPGYDTETNIYGLGYSPDNGVHFYVTYTTFGRKYRQEDADRLWQYLQGFVTAQIGSALKVSWSDITNKPDIATQDDLKKIELTPGPQGPPGANGQTPQITSNGHWKIGNNVTNYSVGMLDTDDSTTLLDLSTDKAIYYPSEKVVFHATSVSGHGHLDVHYYHLNKLVAEKQVYYGTSEIGWSWFLPADDNVGYSVVIDNYVGNNVGYNNKIAINVCSNVYQFPIMGFLSSYTIDSCTDRKQVLDYMKRLHINLVQVYDWFDLHSLPLPVATNGDSLQVSNTWTDIGNRLTRKKVIEDYCNLAKEYAMKPLAYMAMNGSDTNQLVHGLSAEMFLYNDNSKSLDSVYKTLDKNNGWGKYSLYNMNWMNDSWQNYIVNQMQIVRDNMPFDGWHIDMFGDPGDKYESTGNPITSNTLAGGIHYFLNKAGNLGWDIGVNSVGEYGLDDIRNSIVPKYLYTEVWDNRKTYNDLFNLVKFLTESRDSNNQKKGVIIAAYMDYNYAKSNQGKSFNDDGIILTDLVIMASGGMHLEVGEHLLDNEYFPNNNLNMSDSLKNTYLPEMYDFFTAFKEIIGLGYQVDGLATIDGGSVDSLVAGEVCGISRGNDKGYLGLSIINMQTNGDQWRDTDANRTITKPVGNVKVTLNKGVTNHDWYLFNLGNLTPQKINVGTDGVINISGLEYYSFILGVPII